MSLSSFIVGLRLIGPNGLKETTSLIITDNALPAQGYVITPALCNLKSFEVNALQTDYLDPVVTAVNGLELLANIGGKLLKFFYPSGGGAAAPTTPAAPKAVTTPDAGATTMTGSVAKPALSAVVTPGLGKVCPTNTDLTGCSVVVKATGY